MANNTNTEVKELKPLQKIILSLGLLPTSYLESMTYAELVMWFCNFLQEQVIPTVNNNAEAVIELQNWFNTLNLQDEVDNKLDEMAESGELTDIIAQYLGLAGVIAFNTIADMKLAENLVIGSKCKTLGFNSYNDGGGAYYEVRQVTNDDVIDEMTLISLYNNVLVAELIIPDEVTVEMFGAVGDGTTDDKVAIRKAISIGKTINFDGNKTYAIGYDLEDYTINGVPTKRANYLVITSPVILHGNNAKLKLLTNPCGIYNGIRIQSTNNVLIDNLKIIGDRDVHTTTYLIDDYAGEWGHCLTLRDSSNIKISNVEVEKAWGDGLNVGGNSEDIILDNCISDNSRRNGLTIGPSENVHVTNCIFKNTNGVAPQAGVDIEPDAVSGITLNNIILDKCYSYNNSGSGYEINTSAFSQINTGETIDVKLINCKSDSCYYGFTYLAIPSNASQSYNYDGTVLLNKCYIANTTSHGGLIQFEKPTKTAQCIIDDCVFDSYANYGLFGDFNHSIDTDTIWGGSVVRNTKFTNVPADTSYYKCAIMWGVTGYVEGNRYDLTVDKCHVDDPNPIYWGGIANGYGKIEWDQKPIVIVPSGYTHTRFNGLLIGNRADNVGFILPSRAVCNREYELYCVTGTSCFVARYGFGDAGITTDDKIISTVSTSGSSSYTIALAKRVKVVPYDEHYWIAT